MWGPTYPPLALCETVTCDNPVYLCSLMEHHEVSYVLYDAMRKDDLSEAVMVANRFLMVTRNMPQIRKLTKCEKESEFFRRCGNDQLQKREFQKAIELYNNALLMAPRGSLAMKLAYSNRSALLFSLKLYTAALKDIGTVFALGCPENLVETLKTRKNKCTAKIVNEKTAEKKFYTKDNFFRFDVEKNPEIPCASSHVEVKMAKGMPEVVAKNDIHIGQLVALETAFISQNGEHNRLTACHYCHKFDLNLIPCEKCCFILFCDSECRRKCNEEYHDTECHIMEFLDHVTENNDYFGMAVKAVIKMWTQTKDWTNVITASEEMGRKMTKGSSMSDIFDGKKPFSLLAFDDEQHLNYGKLYNESWNCAVLLHFLLNVPSFLPESFAEKEKAKRAIARLLLGIRSYVPKLLIHEAFGVMKAAHKKDGNYTVDNSSSCNQGYFSFAGKLKHECDSNLMIFGLGHKIALVAVKPIKRGEELTVSYISRPAQGYTPGRMKRAVTLYTEYHIVCSCHICRPADFSLTPSAEHIGCIIRDPKLFMEIYNSAEGSMRHFKTICSVLASFSDMPSSGAYAMYIELFIRCMTHFQVSLTRNAILESLLLNPEKKQNKYTAKF